MNLNYNEKILKTKTLVNIYDLLAKRYTFHLQEVNENDIIKLRLLTQEYTELYHDEIKALVLFDPPISLLNKMKPIIYPYKLKNLNRCFNSKSFYHIFLKLDKIENHCLDHLINLYNNADVNSELNRLHSRFFIKKKTKSLDELESCFRLLINPLLGLMEFITNEQRKKILMSLTHTFLSALFNFKKEITDSLRDESKPNFSISEIIQYVPDPLSLIEQLDLTSKERQEALSKLL